MRRQNVQEAYERIRPDQETRERMLDNILSAASVGPPVRKDVIMKRRKMKPIVIAAIIALMVLMMGCAVVAMNLQDMKIGEYTYTQPRYIDENGEKVYETEVTRDVISLQGIEGSPSQMAAREWYEFEQSYDQDGKLLSEADQNPMDIPEAYDAYFVYTQEMIDKVDEIAEKYDLELAGAVAMAEEYQMDIFFGALGIENLHREESGVEMDYLFGYFYECANFNMEFYVNLPQEKAKWDHDILASMRYCGKNYLDTVFSYIGSMENYEQWTYTMADGNEVLIIMGEDKARIFFDGEDAFISVGLNTAYEGESGVTEHMTRQDVELTAEVLDFTVEPQKPDMASVTKKLEESFQDYLAEQKAQMETWVNPFIQEYGSYTDVASHILENSSSPESIYYTLWDVNGDGSAEMLIGIESSFGTVKTQKDGEIITLISNGTEAGFYLCENEIIMAHEDPNEEYYRFLKLTSDGYGVCDSVYYDVWEESWCRSKDGNTQYISEEEAMAIIDSYGCIDVEMKPITEFPME